MINKTHNIDCESGMRELNDESIDLVITSPPYFNAREYSQWETVTDYMTDMKNIFTEVYRILKNHKVIVVNVGDIVSQVGNAKWDTRKLPLGAYFTVMLENIGFTFIDDYIWDKGEPQSKRHLGNPPYPFYQYPVNVYEHILIFEKNELSTNKIPCPVCNKTITVSNSQTKQGVQSWECKNQQCPEKSKTGRGKRFSARSVMMSDYQQEKNEIPKWFVEKWRRDITKINPVHKFVTTGENIVGHSAPFPKDIPEMAIRYFSGVEDVVLDPFMGSGTTGIVCKKLNRNYIGFELDKEYCELANKRVEEYDVQLELEI